MALSFLGLYIRFKHLNKMTPADKEWLAKAKNMVDGNDHDMPEQGVAGNDGVRPDRGVVANFDVRTNDRIRTDLDIVANSCSRINDGSSMNHRHRSRFAHISLASAAS